MGAGRISSEEIQRRTVVGRWAFLPAPTGQAAFIKMHTQSFTLGYSLLLPTGGAGDASLKFHVSKSGCRPTVLNQLSQGRSALGWHYHQMFWDRDLHFVIESAVHIAMFCEDRNIIWRYERRLFRVISFPEINQLIWHINCESFSFLIVQRDKDISHPITSSQYGFRTRQPI